MKASVYISVILFLITIPVNAQEGWFWQNPLPQGNSLNSVYFINENFGWGVGDYATIINTTNGGYNWIRQVSKTGYNLFSVFFIDQNTGWTGGIYTIFKTTNGGVTFIEDENNPSQPNSFLLSQNYPNPFNPTTKIKYSIPVGTRDRVSVQMKLYDVLGKEVETLVNEEKPAGEYVVEFPPQSEEAIFQAESIFTS